MSLMYVTLADTSKVGTTYRTKQKVLNGVSSTWSEQGFRESKFLISHGSPLISAPKIQQGSCKLFLDQEYEDLPETPEEGFPVEKEA